MADTFVSGLYGCVRRSRLVLRAVGGFGDAGWCSVDDCHSGEPGAVGNGWWEEDLEL